MPSIAFPKVLPKVRITGLFCTEQLLEASICRAVNVTVAEDYPSDSYKCHESAFCNSQWSGRVNL